MYNGLLVFEQRIVKDSKGNYYDLAVTDEVLSRYTKCVDQLYVLARADLLMESEREIVKRYAKITDKKVKIIEIPNILSISGLRYNVQIRKKIVRLIQKVNIIFVKVPTIWQGKLLRLAEVNQIPCILEVGADAWATYWNINGIKAKIFAVFIEISTRVTVKKSKYTLYVTNRWLQKKYPTDGRQIACSDVCISDNAKYILEERRTKIQHTEGKIVLGTLADVSVKSKGHEYVIMALAEFKRRGIDRYEYRMAGGGDNSRLFCIAQKYNVADFVKFDGPIRHDKIKDWFDNIDIYVLPSRQEGLPRALIEAMSYGLPAFGAKTGGIPELLDGKYIFSNTKKNITEICEILERFNKSSMIAQSITNFKKAKQYIPCVTDKVRSEFYADVIRENRK